MSAQRTPLQDFRTQLCILRSIDYDELVDAGVNLLEVSWTEFNQNPYWTFLAMSDRNADKVWSIIERRS